MPIQSTPRSSATADLAFLHSAHPSCMIQGIGKALNTQLSLNNAHNHLPWH
jgi:hypothetical protein